MKKLIARWLGSRFLTPTPNSDQAGFAVSRMTEENPATIEDGSDNALRRQLVQVLLRDVTRRHGIPPALIECQMLVVSSRSRGQGMYVRLVLKQWDERLLHYAFAFQNALMADIVRFEPKASEWLHGVSWQFEFDGSCPYAELPDKSFWLTPASPVASTYSSGGFEQTAPALTATELAAVARQANAARRAALASFDNPTNHFASERRGAPTDLLPLSVTPTDVKKTEEAEDIELLFAIRDRELTQPAGGGIAQVGYERTRPSPL
jgi:hypothetical protein